MAVQSFASFFGVGPVKVFKMYLLRLFEARLSKVDFEISPRRVWMYLLNKNKIPRQKIVCKSTARMLWSLVQQRSCSCVLPFFSDFLPCLRAPLFLALDTVPRKGYSQRHCVAETCHTFCAVPPVVQWERTFELPEGGQCSLAREEQKCSFCFEVL